MAMFSIVGLLVCVTGGLSYLLYPQDDRLLGWPFFVNDHFIRLGSTRSCDVQGAITNGGYVISQGYLSSLFVYYFSEIVLRMRNEFMKKVIEVWLHIIPIIGGLVVIVWGLRSQSFNPHPIVSWCAFIRYPPLCPDHCWEPDDAGCECIRGNPEDDFNFNGRLIPAMLYFYSTVDFVCIFAIAIKFIVYDAELKRKLKELKNTGLDLEEERDELKEISFKKTTTRDTLFQAFLYALMLVAMFVSSVMIYYTQDTISYDIANAFRMFFATIQGLLYFIIFLYIKVHNLQFLRPELSKWDAMKQTFFASLDDRVVLVGLPNISDRERDHEIQSKEIEAIHRYHVDVIDRNGLDGNGNPSIQTPSGATIFPLSTAHSEINQMLDSKDDRSNMSEYSNHSQSLGSMFSNDIQSIQTPSGATIFPLSEGHSEQNQMLDSKDDRSKMSEYSNHSQSLGSMFSSKFDLYHDQ
jgi:hypothetical protein